MKIIIQQIAEEFIKKIEKTFEKGEININLIENDFLKEAKECAAELTKAYIERLDSELVAMKKERKQAEIVIERRNDKRCLQTQIGEICFNRTYFYNKKVGEYSYLVDNTIGLEKRSRVSNAMSEILVNTAKEMSYEKTAKLIGDSKITKQTVMNAIRKANVENFTEVLDKPSLSVLHVDADEAHVTIRNGRKAIVPLISIYQGIETKGKRNSCKDIFHISEFGKNPDELWEKALNEIEKRYDISNTKIYLHGDGGRWIQTGLEWLTKSKFVLDKYHKNKAIKQMTAGLINSDRIIYDNELREALNTQDIRFIEELTLSIINTIPERIDKIKKASQYLITFINGISICKYDKEANNGGCTEPHVSHVLANRLSTRPMAWSKETLEHMAPILAKGEAFINTDNLKDKSPTFQRKAIRKVSRAFKFSKGLPIPRSIGNKPILSNGKVTPLFKVLHSISQ